MEVTRQAAKCCYESFLISLHETIFNKEIVRSSYKSNSTQQLMDEIQQCSLFKQWFRSSVKPTQLIHQFIMDLFNLTIGIRDCVLVDYFILKDDEKMTQFLLKLAKQSNSERIRILRITFPTLVGRNWEEMTFTYLINETIFKERIADLLHSHEWIHDKVFVNIDQLEKKSTQIPSIENSTNSKIVNHVVPFVTMIFNSVERHFMASENLIGCNLDEFKVKFKELPFIPFDGTLLNALMLNYPILLFYGSRFSQDVEIVRQPFFADHCLNNIDLNRRTLTMSDNNMLNQVQVLQFVIPKQVEDGHESTIQSCIATWLLKKQKILTTGQNTKSNIILSVNFETISYDNIVL